MATIRDAIVFLKTLTLNKLFNGFLLRASYRLSILFQKQIHWGNPEFLSIEPTSLCNLHCPGCPSGNNTLDRNRTFLSLASYKSIIDQGQKHLSYLQLFFQGEPLLHPKFVKMAEYAVKSNIYTSTSTNGLLLTREKAKEIVKSGLQRIIVSMDGTTQETYEKYRVGGNIEQVKKGIENLVQAKKELGSNTPFLILQLVVFKWNEHQVEEIQTLGKTLKVDKVELKTAQLYPFENGNAQMPENKKYSRYKAAGKGKFILDRKNKFYCKRIWTGGVITAEKELLPCCFDKSAKHSYGIVGDKTIALAFHSSKARTLRTQVWKNSAMPEMCKNCSEGLNTRVSL
jgi:MoaA/NifB/PqqE/SkfB family radical SAM enzyme